MLWAGSISQRHLNCFVEAAVKQSRLPDVFITVPGVKSVPVSATQAAWFQHKEKRKYPSISLVNIPACSLSFPCHLSPVFIWKPFSSECRTLLASRAWDSVPFRFWFIAGGSRNRPALSRGWGDSSNCDVWQVLLRRALLYQSINTLHTNFKQPMLWMLAWCGDRLLICLTFAMTFMSQAKIYNM